MALVQEYDTEVSNLFKKPVDGESSERLARIGKILASWSCVLPATRLEKERSLTITALMKKANLAADTWRKESEELDTQAALRFEHPALKALVLLEGHAADAGRAAEQAVTASTTAGSATDIEEPALAAAKALSAAEGEHDGLAELAIKAGNAKVVKAKADAYLTAATRALDLAKRMAGIADEVLTSWQMADNRRREADRAIDEARSKIVDLENNVERDRQLVDYLREYAEELAVDLGLMSDRTYHIEGGLNAVLLGVRSELAQARSTLHDAERALLDGRGNLSMVTEAESIAAEKTKDTAVTGSSLRSKDVAVGIADAAGQTELRLLAGGVEAAERLQLAVPDQSRLIGLLKALGPKQTEVWLRPEHVGGTLAQATLDAFGIEGLRDLVHDVADIALRQLLRVLTPARLAELVQGLTGRRVNALAAVFAPPELDDFATQLTATPLSELLDHVGAPALKEMGLTASSLKPVLLEVSTASVGELVRELGAQKANHVLVAFAPSELKALLVDLPPSAIAGLDTTPTRIKALLKQFTAKELADFGLSDAQFKAVTAAVDAPRLKALALALGYVSVRGLVVAYPKGKDLNALLADVASTNDAVLVDLCTQFTGTQIRDFRIAVGAPRFISLLFDKALPAAALETYGAPMFEGVHRRGQRRLDSSHHSLDLLYVSADLRSPRRGRVHHVHRPRAARRTWRHQRHTHSTSGYARRDLQGAVPNARQPRCKRRIEDPDPGSQRRLRDMAAQAQRRSLGIDPLSELPDRCGQVRRFGFHRPRLRGLLQHWPAGRHRVPDVSVDRVADAVVDAIAVERTSPGDRFFTRGRATLDAGTARGVLEAFVTVSSADEARFLISGADRLEGRATDGSSFAFVSATAGREVILEVGAGRCAAVSPGAFARLMARWEAALDD